jgi:TPR repeat protein
MSAIAGIIPTKTREIKPNTLKLAPPTPAVAAAVDPSRPHDGKKRKSTTVIPKSEEPLADEPKLEAALDAAKPNESRPAEPQPDEPKQSIEVVLAQKFNYRLLNDLEKINLYELNKLHFRSRTGDRGALFDLGRCCVRGIHCPPDMSKAALYFQAAADKGFAPAMFNLALYLFKTNNKKAVEWFRKAANAGYTKAQHYLGIAFLQNYGVVPCSENLKTAYNCFKLANEQGEEKSKHYLGICLRFFRTYGIHIPKDLELSLDDQFFETYYTTTATNQSRFDHTPPSELKKMPLTEIQLMEKFVNSDRAKEKPPLKLANVLFNVARCYFKGFGVPKNFKIAVPYCTRAAKLNFAPAQELLGSYNKLLASHYRKKASIDTTHQQTYIKQAVEAEELALKYFAEAADNGYIPAQYNLALCYKDNIGTQALINPKLAFTWFMRAALHGHKDAEQWVAWCHANHFGIPNDLQGGKRTKIIAKKSSSLADNPQEPKKSAASEKPSQPSGAPAAQPEAVLASKSTGAQHADKRRKPN